MSWAVFDYWVIQIGLDPGSFFLFRYNPEVALPRKLTAVSSTEFDRWERNAKLPKLGVDIGYIIQPMATYISNETLFVNWPSDVGL